jgi:hypothetical protein
MVLCADQRVPCVQSVDIADVVFLVRIGKLYKSINPASSLACVIVARDIAPRYAHISF